PSCCALLPTLFPYTTLFRSLGAAQDQGVDVVRALVSVDHLEVDHVPDHAEFVGNAVAPVHVAREARDLERLAAGVALHDRGDLRSEEHTSELQSRENLVCRL